MVSLNKGNIITKKYVPGDLSGKDRSALLKLIIGLPKEALVALKGTVFTKKHPKP